MLINLSPDLVEIEMRHEVAKEYKFEYMAQSHSKWLQETGIYQSSFPFNFPEEEFIELQVLTWEDRYKIFPNYEKVTYGVADNIDQIKEYNKEEIDDVENRYVISLTPVW